MTENNIGYNDQQNTPVRTKDGSGAVKTAAIIMAVGFILFIAGYIMYLNTDKSKYIKVKDYSNGFDGDKVNDIDLDIGWGKVIIEKNTYDDISVDAEDVPEKFSAEISGDKLTVKCNTKITKTGSLVSFISRNDYDPVVKIMLPEKDFERISLSLGAGDAVLSGMSCSALEIDCGAGDVTLNDITCSGKIDIDGGTGDIDINNAVAGGVDLDLGVGNFDFTGTVNGDIIADGGVGDISFRLTNPAEDFSSGGKYTLSCDKGIGSIDMVYNVEMKEN